MQLSIIIDNRETKLYSNIIERDLDVYKDKISIEKTQLDIGDIHIKFNDIIYVYERKTVSDLLSSIKDGRYKEQKHRLLSSGVATINYIIEGDSITSHKNFNNQKLLTSIYLNSTYRDKINVFFTSNIDDTSTFILLLATKIIDKPENFISTPDNNQDYIDVCKIKTKKCSNIDKDTCYLLQLSQIPTISKEIAKKIKDAYPTMPILIQTLESKSDIKEKIKLLSSIDGIGSKKATTIIDYLS
jgi:crossover junction endonuclease MUS81